MTTQLESALLGWRSGSTPLDILGEPAPSVSVERCIRRIFERVVAACMAAGLVKGEGFAVDASVMEANASRYHGKAPDEIEWAEPERQTCAVKEYLAALDVEVEPNPDRKPPKVISPRDPQSAWTAKATNG